jgi:hypothetical protein
MLSPAVGLTTMGLWRFGRTITQLDPTGKTLNEEFEMAQVASMEGTMAA